MTVHSSDPERAPKARSQELPVFYAPSYTMSAYEFDTTRKATWVATSLKERPISGVALIEPPSLTQVMIEAVHDPEYVAAVKRGTPLALAKSSGLGWNRGVWDAVCASNGGAVAATTKAWQSRAHAGSLSSGLHHASAGRGKGFCTFNGLALAAREVLSAGARRVLILDLDAHCGGGTYGIVREWPLVVHLDISVSAIDHYTVEASTPSTLDLVTDAAEYLPTLRARLSDRSGVEFDAVIYNAGVDPHEDCDIGGLPGITDAILAEREQIVFDWARGQHVPVAFVLAGGYKGDRLQQDALVNLHRMTIAAAAIGNAGATLTINGIRNLAGASGREASVSRKHQ